MHSMPTAGLPSGDIGSVGDADGYLRVVDRLKELIKYKGFPESRPAELEGLLLRPPSGGRRRGDPDS